MRPFPIDADTDYNDTFIYAIVIVYAIWIVKKYITRIIIRKNV